jgi:glucokinase
MKPDPADEGLLGIDLGGTNVRVGVMDREGRVLAWNQVPIEARRGPQAGLERIFQLIEDTLQQIKPIHLLGIGIGSTGPVDRKLGAIQNPYTLPTWENVDVVSPISQRYSVPVALENDADAALLGEYWCGAGRGVSPLYMLTLGTGVGSALMVGGELYRGSGGFHPEAGHSIVDPSGPLCYCGAHGCLEILIAGPAIARRAQERAACGPTCLIELASGKIEAIDAGMVAQAALAGDPIALQLVEETGYYLGLGLANILRMFYPAKILLYGGGLKSYPLFQASMQATLQRHLVLEPDHDIPVELATLGEQAGIIGAGYAAYKLLE